MFYEALVVLSLVSVIATYLWFVFFCITRDEYRWVNHPPKDPPPPPRKK